VARRYRLNFGRKTVQPFKEADINNILVICKKRRNQYELQNKVEQKYSWDRNYMIVVLGINLAFRIEDILQLRVDNFKNGNVYIREFKTNKEQSFELHPKLFKDIADYIKRNDLIDGEYLFKSRKGINKPITRQRSWQIIKSLAEEVKIGYPVGCHSLRKYFGRKFYEQTGDIITLKEMLNHSSERITLMYICWDIDKKNESRKSFYLGS